MVRLPRWYRSSPWIGLVGGICIGLGYRLGITGGTYWWLDDVGITALFDAFVPLGYLALAAIGFSFGWVLRSLERRHAPSE